MGGCCSGIDQHSGNMTRYSHSKPAPPPSEILNKILLLGPSESGKTTLFKQMIVLHGTGYSVGDRQGFLPVIYNNTLTAMKNLITFSDEFADEGADTRISDENKDAKTAILELSQDREEEIDEILAEHIHSLWKDPGIQATFEKRSTFQIFDSAEYFFQRVKKVAERDFIPTQQDIMRVRVKTTGIIQLAFDVDGNELEIWDVGGQRNERKKWVHCFEVCSSLIYVAAISEYDQVLYEDDCTNRLIETLNLFEQIINSHYFINRPIILFLNKCDIFRDKIEQVPLKMCFPDYDGPNDYDIGLDYIKKQFLSRKKTQQNNLYIHTTCATDSRNMLQTIRELNENIVNDDNPSGYQT